MGHPISPPVCAAAAREHPDRASHRTACAALSAVLVLVMLVPSCRRRENAPASPPPAMDAHYDVKFLDTMDLHHRHAIGIWELVAERAEHPELRLYAAKVITEQKREIMLMDLWRNRWWSEVPRPLYHRDEATEITSDLRAARGARFDAAFLSMMIPHHQRAAAMASDAVRNATMPEVRQLAEIIVNQQEEEVSIMSAWQKSWFLGSSSKMPMDSRGERR